MRRLPGPPRRRGIARLSLDHALIIIVRTDPKPCEDLPLAESQRANAIGDASGPELAYRFQLDEGYPGFSTRSSNCFSARRRISSGNLLYDSQNEESALCWKITRGTGPGTTWLE